MKRRSTPRLMPSILWAKPESTLCSVRLPVPLAFMALWVVMNRPHRLTVSLFSATLAWQAETSATFSPSIHSSPQVPEMTRLALSMVLAMSIPPYRLSTESWKSSMASTKRPPTRTKTQLPV